MESNKGSGDSLLEKETSIQLPDDMFWGVDGLSQKLENKALK